jgi:hypothetical protein
MTRYAPLWQQAGSYPASLDRGLIASLWPSGGVSGGVVSAVAGTMTVSVAPGTAAVLLQSGQGAALCRWDANEIVTIATAPPSGQSRIDLICAQVRDNGLDAGGNNDFIMTVTAGTPAASNPAVPATPTNALAIAQVLVPGAVANLNTATVTDRRSWALGAPVPGQLLAAKAITAPTYGTTSTNFACVDTVNAVLTFTVPPSGRVLFSAAGLYNVGTAGLLIMLSWSQGIVSNAGFITTWTRVGVVDGTRYVTVPHITNAALTPGALVTCALQWALLSAGSATLGSGNTDLVLTATALP